MGHFITNALQDIVSKKLFDIYMKLNYNIFKLLKRVKKSHPKIGNKVFSLKIGNIPLFSALNKMFSLQV